MIDKAIDFIMRIGMNGIVAFFVAAIYYVIVAIALVLAMIPVSIIAGDAVSKKIMDFAEYELGFKAAYTLAFAMLMMDDLGIPNIKTLYKRWQKKRANAQKP